MKEKEIVECNKLIAEFMGLTVEAHRVYNKNNTIPIELFPNMYSGIQYRMSLEELRFSSSWDWLMPVVEKIAELKYPISLYFSHIQNSTSIMQLNNDFDNNYNLVRESETRRTTPAIQVAFNAVIEFIKWHKTQTQ